MTQPSLTGEESERAHQAAGSNIGATQPTADAALAGTSLSQAQPQSQASHRQLLLLYGWIAQLLGPAIKSGSVNTSKASTPAHPAKKQGQDTANTTAPALVTLNEQQAMQLLSDLLASERGQGVQHERGVCVFACCLLEECVPRADLVAFVCRISHV